MTVSRIVESSDRSTLESSPHPGVNLFRSYRKGSPPLLRPRGIFNRLLKTKYINAPPPAFSTFGNQPEALLVYLINILSRVY